MVIKYRAQRATYDLDHLETLSDDPDLILLVSERTLYLLQNEAVCEIADHNRYSVATLETGDYVPVHEGDSQWPLAQSTIENAQLELMDRTNEMIDWLENITNRVAPIKSTPQIITTAFSAPGSALCTFGPVDSDEIWKVNTVATAITGGVANWFTGAHVNAAESVSVVFHYVGNPVTGAWYPLLPQLTLTAGDRMRYTWNIASGAGNALVHVSYDKILLPLEQ